MFQGDLHKITKYIGAIVLDSATEKESETGRLIVDSILIEETDASRSAFLPF